MGLALAVHNSSGTNEGLHNFLSRGKRDTAQAAADINWADVDDLAPEWDRVESGIDDLLSLSTTYWEPGLGPRAPRRVLGDEVNLVPPPQSLEENNEERGTTEDDVSMEPGKGGPTPHQLNAMMHQALITVNVALEELEKEKGEYLECSRIVAKQIGTGPAHVGSKILVIVGL